MNIFKRLSYRLLLFIVFLVGETVAVYATTDCNAVTEIPASECQALLELYNSTNGPTWRDNTGWNQTNTPCSWFGVTCDSGHVTAINLEDGSISPEVISFGNSLVGQIPDLNLPNLTKLYLGNNQLSGNIPNFSNLPNLTNLRLGYNELSGNIPNFSNLPNLTDLSLSYNELSGNIPNFSNLPNLTYLWLNNNQLSGNIPNFSNLPNLIYLWLNNNQLSGNIPNFSNLPNLTELHLYSNQLSGNIPNFSNLPNLIELHLYSNQLSGNVPNFSNLPNLTELHLYSNQLSGNIPNFSNLPDLTYLWLNNNQLSGNIPNFSNLPNLIYLWLNNNQLSGNIPNFSNLLSLESLALYNNQLSGNIPNFSNLPSLKHLWLSNNQLSGNIPNFSNLSSLKYLALNNNQLSGNIPNFTAFNLSSLEEISFNGNCGLIAYDAAQESILSSKGPEWQTQNPNCSATSESVLPSLGDNFAGGISVNGQPHQAQVTLNLADTVAITGDIVVRTEDIGKAADIFVYAEATISPSSEIRYFMLENGINILNWDKNPANLATFMRTTLVTPQTVSMYQRTFYYPGTLKVYFGYRLTDGTTVINNQPIDITILD